jgi:hypothetical protein
MIVITPRVLSKGQGPLSAERGRGRALAYRSAPHHLGSFACDAAGQRLARNPLPRATRGAFARAADRVVST